MDTREKFCTYNALTTIERPQWFQCFRMPHLHLESRTRCEVIKEERTLMCGATCYITTICNHRVLSQVLQPIMNGLNECGAMCSGVSDKFSTAYCMG